MTLSNLAGFAVTKLRLVLLLSLVLTWWLAHVSPSYTSIFRASVSSRIHDAKRRIPTVVVNWHPRQIPKDHYNSTKLALLIEPRPIPQLIPLVLHMIAIVPPDWRFLYIGSAESVLMLGRAHAVQHHQLNGKLDLEVLPPPWEMQRKEDVSRILTDINFYDKVLPGVEWLFKYETDSILCANSERSLDDWLGWSWAGLGRIDSGHPTDSRGLSIRRVSAVRRILSFQERFNDTEPENEWFRKRFESLPGEQARKLMNGEPMDEKTLVHRPLGYHVPADGSTLGGEMWRDPGSRKSILEYCPELSIIMEMKLERERCPDDDRRGRRVSPPERNAVHVTGKLMKEEARPMLSVAEELHRPSP
ncbi:hypothetical protein G7046_g6721 [Stylonectria norvegica]|nr:hypothetical protein G7046_g6721 [Stylonectria norvegica]